MDPASGIGIPVAFGAGLISFLSPCVLPLVPGYISAVAGGVPGEVRAARVLGPSLAFVGAFSVIFISLGLLGQQAIHGALRGPTALKVCGAIIIVMGVVFVLAPFVPRLAREWHFGRLTSRAGRGGPVLTGAAFALAWTLPRPVRGEREPFDAGGGALLALALSFMLLALNRLRPPGPEAAALIVLAAAGFVLVNPPYTDVERRRAAEILAKEDVLDLALGALVDVDALRVIDAGLAQLFS